MAVHQAGHGQLSRSSRARRSEKRVGPVGTEITDAGRACVLERDEFRLDTTAAARSVEGRRHAARERGREGRGINESDARLRIRCGANLAQMAQQQFARATAIRAVDHVDRLVDGEVAGGEVRIAHLIPVGQLAREDAAEIVVAQREARSSGYGRGRTLECIGRSGRTGYIGNRDGRRDVGDLDQGAVAVRRSQRAGGVRGDLRRRQGCITVGKVHVAGHAGAKCGCQVLQKRSLADTGAGDDVSKRVRIRAEFQNFRLDGRPDERRTTAEERRCHCGRGGACRRKGESGGDAGFARIQVHEKSFEGDNESKRSVPSSKLPLQTAIEI